MQKKTMSRILTAFDRLNVELNLHWFNIYILYPLLSKKKIANFFRKIYQTNGLKIAHTPLIPVRFLRMCCHHHRQRQGGETTNKKCLPWRIYVPKEASNNRTQDTIRFVATWHPAQGEKRQRLVHRVYNRWRHRKILSALWCFRVFAWRGPREKHQHQHQHKRSK